MIQRRVISWHDVVGHPPFRVDDPDQAVECILFEEPDYPPFLSDGAVDFLSMVSIGVWRGGEGRGGAGEGRGRGRGQEPDCPAFLSDGAVDFISMV